MCALMGSHCELCQYYWIDETDPSGRGFPCQYKGKDIEKFCEAMMALEDEMIKEENREW